MESKQGYIEIEVEFDNLQPATKNGAEYLTYVLWAITPEGRTSNLGEILLNGTKSKLNVTTELQVFGLVVTAEPYFAVTQPSDLIVMENVVRADTKGKIEEIDAKYELLQRGQYQRLSNPLALKLDQKLPLELYEARNAVQIARAVGADRFATETFQKAEKSLAAGRSLPGTQRRQEAGNHDCPGSRADGGRLAGNRRQTPGGRCPGRGAAAVGGSRSTRGERTRSRAVRDGSRHPGSRSGADQGAGGFGTLDAGEGCAGGGRSGGSRSREARERRPHGGRRSRRGSPEGWKTRRARRPPKPRRTA